MKNANLISPPLTKRPTTGTNTTTSHSIWQLLQIAQLNYVVSSLVGQSSSTNRITDCGQRASCWW